MKSAAIFFGGLIIVVCGIIFAIGYGINAMHSYSCASKWEDSPYPHTQYGFIAGCRVSKDGKVYLPATSVREF